MPVDVRFALNLTRLLRSSEMTRWATSGHCNRDELKRVMEQTSTSSMSDSTPPATKAHIAAERA
jgi:hypothetical protein